MNRFEYLEEQDYSAVLIYKDDVGVFVLLYDRVVAVISTTKIADDGRTPVILLYKETSCTEDAHDKFLHISGKMLKKTDARRISKYFDCQRVDEHLRNGMHGGEHKELIAEVVEKAKTLVNSLKLGA